MIDQKHDFQPFFSEAPKKEIGIEFNFFLRCSRDKKMFNGGALQLLNWEFVGRHKVRKLSHNLRGVYGNDRSDLSEEILLLALDFIHVSAFALLLTMISFFKKILVD
ncbi:hypothetical protein PPYR_12050 [Photinus pyralis]|uniref:Uncharacterized protein n=1 Tax=Photinus pyralis TaxID=7054 RepID=A0A5N4AD28_PHOPY|nr:hypothetical protein PPYR_11996 [Photinus pyralis]KAB0795211.1 hypothetical protein PPYR_12050 [Photinus pyralis]